MEGEIEGGMEGGREEGGEGEGSNEDECMCVNFILPLTFMVKTSAFHRCDIQCPFRRNSFRC